MSNYVRIAGKLEGADELVASIQAVGLNVKGTTRKGVRAGCKVFQEEANRRAETLSSRRGKAATVKVGSRQKNAVTGQVMPSKKKWYLRFFETGTKAGVRQARGGGAFFFRKGGKSIKVRRINHPGMAARPWLRPAFDAAQNRARDAFGAAMRQAVETQRALIDNGTDEE
jgi:HK97 gp10 family phage protein